MDLQSDSSGNTSKCPGLTQGPLWYVPGCLPLYATCPMPETLPSLNYSCCPKQSSPTQIQAVARVAMFPGMPAQIPSSEKPFPTPGLCLLLCPGSSLFSLDCDLLQEQGRDPSVLHTAGEMLRAEGAVCPAPAHPENARNVSYPRSSLDCLRLPTFVLVAVPSLV